MDQFDFFLSGGEENDQLGECYTKARSGQYNDIHIFEVSDCSKDDETLERMHEWAPNFTYHYYPSQEMLSVCLEWAVKAYQSMRVTGRTLFVIELPGICYLREKLAHAFKTLGACQKSLCISTSVYGEIELLLASSH